MAKISLDLSTIKSAGIYVLEIDESQRPEAQISALRLLVGFAGKSPFNRPVYLQNEIQRQKVLGDIDSKLEKKGCFFNRNAKAMLSSGSILALNLLKVDESYDGPDQVNYAALSLDAGKRNPIVASAGTTYGEVDYLADSIDKQIYGTKSGDVIPFIGKTPYSSLFDRSRFWVPSENNLMQIAAAGLGVAGYTFEKANFINFANTGTDEISILVMKAENFKGYDITAKDWYGGEENIPYKWIRPSDYISDYFIRVIAVKGNWTNYPMLSSGSIYGKYFDQKGILKNKISQFNQAEGVTFIGSWTGCIIPDFTDKQGNYLYIKDRVNAQTETTGLLMSINEDAMEVISYDLNGIDVETGQINGKGSWIYDYDGNSEGDSDAGETEIGSNGFLIDMVGHSFQEGISKKTENRKLETKFAASIFDHNSGTLGDVSVYYLDDSSVDLTGGLVTNNTFVKVPAYDEKKNEPLYLYGVYDSSTNRRLKNDYCYVALDNATYKSNPDSAAIKAMKAYDANGNVSTGTIAAVAPTVDTVRLKKDLNDNVLYKDTSVIFGNYAAYVNNTSTNEKSVYIFSVQSGSNGSEVVDETILNVDSMDELNIGIKDSKGAVVDTSVKCFNYNATKYYLNATDKDATFYIDEETGAAESFGINFLSYNYVSDNSEEVLCNVRNAFYFNGKVNVAADDTSAVQLEDSSLFNGENPVSSDSLNMFIVTDEQEAGNITIGDFVSNITFNNNIGEATKYGLIPGITRVVQKIFVNLTANNVFTYRGKTYTYNNAVAPCIKTKSGKRGFYLFTAVDPVLIDKNHIITRQLPITDDVISKSLRFIPLKGLNLSARHRPGYDKNGRINVEAGIEKIYSMLNEPGINESLCNTNVLDYRYIVDSMSYGIDTELGGKRYLSKLAMDRGMTTALLNAPSKAQFQNSRDPYFTDTFDESYAPVPAFNLAQVVAGGNPDMYSTKMFSLPTEDNGSKYAACFYPHLKYRDNNHELRVPPAADISNTFVRKFQGGNPYAITANLDGIIQNPNGYIIGVEDDLGPNDRALLEPFGINSIIRENNNIVIYGNQTCYQDTKSDYNKLHIRENLNTLERDVREVLRGYVFKYNNEQTRAAVVTQVTPILEALRTSGVIDKYTLQCDKFNNTEDVIAEDAMIIDIEVWMNRGCEKIIESIKLKRHSDLVG